LKLLWLHFYLWCV